MSAPSDPVVGIDLGTTNSVIATVQRGHPVVIPARNGRTLTPSVVAVTPAGKTIVGQLARRQAEVNPEGTIAASKRLIGRKFSSSQIKQVLGRLTYRVVGGAHDDVRVAVGDRQFALPEISAFVLRELKADAEAALGCSVRRAVITVPAYFNDAQRQATRDAGQIAGFDVLRIINEPTAAALAYGLQRGQEGKIAVYDLGGGTFDVSVLEMLGGVFQVVATGGDTFLGGEDFDSRLVDWMAEKFRAENAGHDLRRDRLSLQRLKDAAEKAKIELSSYDEVPIHLPFVATIDGVPRHLSVGLTRVELERLTKDLVARTIEIAGQVLTDARLRPADLREVVLVGGMTRMPAVSRAVETWFQRAPCSDVNPDEVVALGAAVQAEALVSAEQNVVLLDVTPMTLGVAIAGGYVRKLIPRNTAVPTQVTETFNTSRDGQTAVKIIVVQGESEVAAQNELLGEFALGGLREAVRGEVSVEVTFEIDSDGVVKVSARDRETGKATSITVTASGGLTRDELQQILENAGDELLEAKSTDERATRLGELQRDMDELRSMVPALKAWLAKSGVAGGSLDKLEAQLAEADKASRGSLSEIVAAHERVQGLIASYRAALAR
ncbi:MAG: molecular chaperone DnaK [Myxococcaceae bacterium]